MEHLDLGRYRLILEDKHQDLFGTLHQRQAITVERSPDAIDEIQSAIEREIAVTELDYHSRMLRNIKAALSRIQEGTFGFCLRCEDQISPARLDAVPWTQFCMHCQREVEEGESPEPLVHSFSHAA
jgi:DnaK suppressor protein